MQRDSKVPAVIPLSESEKERYRFVLDAVNTGQLAMIRATRKSDGQPVALLAVAHTQEEETEVPTFTPIAELLTDNFNEHYTRNDIQTDNSH